MSFLELGIANSDGITAFYASDPSYTYGFLVQQGTPMVKTPQEINDEIVLRRDRMGLDKVFMVTVEGDEGWIRKYKSGLTEPDVVVYVGDAPLLMTAAGLSERDIVDYDWSPGRQVNLDKTIKQRLRRKRRRGKLAAEPNITGTSAREFYEMSNPAVWVEAVKDDRQSYDSYRSISGKFYVPWEGDITTAVIEATEAAQSSSTLEMLKRMGFGSPWWLKGSGQFGDSYVLAYMDPDVDDQWQRPQEQPGGHGIVTTRVYNAWVAGADEYDVWVAFAETAGNTTIEFPGFEGDPTDTVVYRGITLKPTYDNNLDQMDPTRSTGEGAGRGSGKDLGSSWTVDLGVAEVIAERGGAGFENDNATRGAYTWRPFEDKPGPVPTVLRATVDLTSDGVSILQEGYSRYDSEQEIDIRPGTPVTLTGYKQAHPVPIESDALQKAEARRDAMLETGIDPEDPGREPIPEEHRQYSIQRITYLIRWEWDDWVEGVWERKAELSGRISSNELEISRFKNPHLKDFDFDEFLAVDDLFWDKIDSMMEIDDNRVAQDDDYLYALTQNTAKEFIKTLPTEEVALDEIIPTQTWLDQDKLDAGEGWSEDPSSPLVLRSDTGALYMRDGHHRYWHAKKRGDETMVVNVFDPYAGRISKKARPDLTCHICEGLEFVSLKAKEKHYLRVHPKSLYTKHIKDRAGISSNKKVAKPELDFEFGGDGGGGQYNGWIAAYIDTGVEGYLSKVGYLDWAVENDKPDRLWVKMVHVDPEHRGQGIGKAMLEQVVKRNWTDFGEPVPTIWNDYLTEEGEAWWESLEGYPKENVNRLQGRAMSMVRRLVDRSFRR